MSLVTREFVTCDGHCAAEPAEVRPGPRGTAGEIPSTWATVVVGEGPHSGKAMHFCARCWAIAAMAIWATEPRRFVGAYVDKKEPTALATPTATGGG